MSRPTTLWPSLNNRSTSVDPMNPAAPVTSARTGSPYRRAGRLPKVALVAVALVCQLVVEATVSRNYWVASVFVTPMALVMVEFAGPQPAGRLALDRWLDTCVGAAVAVVICFLVPNRRAFDRVALALRELDAVLARAREALSSGRVDHDVRRRLAAALVEVRESADIAAGEWWSTEVPEERIVATERSGHQVLAQLPVRLPVLVR